VSAVNQTRFAGRSIVLMRRPKLLVLQSLLALVTLVGATTGLWPVRPSASAAVDTKSCQRADFGTSTAPSKNQSASRRPVVFVHGWTGAPMSRTADELARRLGGDISTFVFDYRPWSSYWAANDHIAPCLANYLREVSAAYHDVGGDGRVALVAHSMGGLAIRYAMSSASVDHAVTRSQVGWVITVSTPHLGSPFGGLGAAQGVEVLKRVWSEEASNGLPNPFGVDGGRCLGLHDKGSGLPASCNGLPPWLAGGTTLYQVASAVTVRRTFLGVHLYDVPLSSDGVVDVPSARGYLSSGPGGTAPAVSSPTVGTTTHTQYVDCTITFDQLLSAAGSLSGVLGSALGVSAQLLGDYDALKRLQAGSHDPVTLAYDAAALAVASCSHIRVMTYPDTLDLLQQDLRDIVASAPAAVNLKVPANTCGHPGYGWDHAVPIQLHNGAGVARNADGSFAGASIDQAKAIGYDDFDGDGRQDVALEVACFGSLPKQCCAGQASHLRFVAVLSPDPSKPDEPARLVGEVITGGKIFPGDAYGPASLAIRSASLDGPAINTHEYVLYPDEYTAQGLGGRDPFGVYAQTYRLRGGRWISDGVSAQPVGRASGN